MLIKWDLEGGGSRKLNIQVIARIINGVLFEEVPNQNGVIMRAWQNLELVELESKHSSSVLLRLN
jgi:hypothetical protein